MSNILVIGATGNVGSKTVYKLAEEGYSVKAATRNPAGYAGHDNVEAVAFDYMDHSTFGPALEGVDVVSLIALPMDLDALNKLKPFIDLMTEKGIKHVVFISAFGVDQNKEAPLFKVEKAIKDAGLNFTILRPNFFMENFTGFMAPQIKEGAFYIAASKGKTSFIAAADIAEVAVSAIKNEDYNSEYNITGSESLDHYEVAEILSNELGKEVKYVDMPEETMLQGARDNGMPEDMVIYFGFLYQAVRNGWAAPVTEDVEKASGKKPVLFKDFVKENKATWL
jgi:uncharacterized protein YbjT (DUF2867 family)